MQTIRGILLTGVAAGAVAFAGTGEVQAASVTATLSGGVGLAITSNVDPETGMLDEDSPFPYDVFSRAETSAAFPPTYSIGGYQVDQGDNFFEFVTAPGFSATTPAPFWRLETRIEGTAFFTDRLARPGPDVELIGEEEFQTSWTVDYGFGATAQQLSDPTAGLEVDATTAFWQAILFQTASAGLGPSGALDGSEFANLVSVVAGLPGGMAGDTLDWSYDVENAAASPYVDADGTFQFLLSGDNGVASVNTLWAALGFGNIGYFATPNSVPTSLNYTMTMTLTAIPLPAGMPLMLGALGVLGFAGWKRRRARAA